MPPLLKKRQQKNKKNCFCYWLVLVVLENWVFCLDDGNRPPPRKFAVKLNNKNKSRKCVETWNLRNFCSYKTSLCGKTNFKNFVGIYLRASALFPFTKAGRGPLLEVWILIWKLHIAQCHYSWFSTIFCIFICAFPDINLFFINCNLFRFLNYIFLLVCELFLPASTRLLVVSTHLYLFSNSFY